MALHKVIALSDIRVPERLRAVDEDHALAIQASIVERGLIHPITVRHTPAAKGAKYELVAGAHRYRAVEMLEEPAIECIVVEAGKLDAVLIEIEENLFRNDLSKLDRAIFVQTYREVWEQRHGKISRGGDQRSNLHFCPADLIQEEATRGFSVHCAERLGLSIDAVKRSNRIAQNLPPDLRAKLRGTPAEDNQSLLLKFAGLEPEKRAKAAKAIDLAKGDISAAFDLLAEDRRAKPTADQKVASRLIDTWGRASPSLKREFIVNHREEIESLLKETGNA